jgi:tripartite-type tricarboxylate transporter receptor subunit TctC
MLGRISAAIAMTVFGLAAASTASQAQDYPTRPIRLLVGFAAGGPTDVIARIVGQKLEKVLGQPIIIENRTGSSGNLATQTVASATADGYTLLLAANANAVNESLFKNLTFNFAKDFTPIAPLAEAPTLLVVHPSLNVHSVKDLIDLAKEKPGEIMFGTAGMGTTTQLAGELFNLTTGVKMTPVPYRGGAEVMRDLVTGRVKVMFSPIPPVKPFLDSKQLSALASTGLNRSPIVPELPTVAESGLPGYDMRMWFGLVSPKGLSPAIISRLNKAASEAMNDADVKEKLAQQGFSPLTGTPDEFGAYIREDIERWAKVNQATGARID